MKKYLVMLSMLTTVFSAQAGKESGGGGGNAFAAEFQRLAQQADDSFRSRLTFELFGKTFDPQPFHDCVTKLKITPTQHPLRLKGKTVTAINFPEKTEIVLYQNDWIKLDQDAKMQLVIHEILGLAYTKDFDDGSYRVSRPLLSITKEYTIEGVALAMARAKSPLDMVMKVIPERTHMINKVLNMDRRSHSFTMEVAIRTFENSNSSSIRIYHIRFSELQGVLLAEWVRSEGDAGR